MTNILKLSLALVLGSVGVNGVEPSIQQGSEPGLVGYWKLQGDCQDYSGHGNHGVNHDVAPDTGAFDGISPFIEVPNSSSLNLGAGDFALSV